MTFKKPFGEIGYMKGKGGGPSYTPEPVNPTPPVEEATLEDVDSLDIRKDKSKKKLRFNNKEIKPKSSSVGINIASK